MSIHGSCLCGGVEFELDGPVVRMFNCHCSICRKTSGAAHGTFAVGHAKDFTWHKGEDLISQYETPANGPRSFCSNCGSTLPGVDDRYAAMPAGALDDDPVKRPEFHFLTASKASWHEIVDDLPAFEEFPSPSDLG